MELFIPLSKINNTFLIFNISFLKYNILFLIRNEILILRNTINICIYMIFIYNNGIYKTDYQYLYFYFMIKI